MQRFAGQSAIVTGAASGIGAAIAVALAAEGARVVAVDYDPSVKAAAAEYGGVAVVGDVSDPALGSELLDVLAQHGLGLDHLVGAAGIQVRTAGIDIDDADWQRLLNVNLTGFYCLIRALVPALQHGSHGSPGSVVAVTSMSANRAVPGIVPYGSAKAALSHLIRGLAVELGPRGIRLNGIAPGYVNTPMTAPVLAEPATLQRILARLPLQRIAEPEEMAGAALFLMSSEAQYVTGQIIAIDGGYALT